MLGRPLWIQKQRPITTWERMCGKKYTYIICGECESSQHVMLFFIIPRNNEVQCSVLQRSETTVYPTSKFTWNQWIASFDRFICDIRNILSSHLPATFKTSARSELRSLVINAGKLTSKHYVQLIWTTPNLAVCMRLGMYKITNILSANVCLIHIF